jgi:DNA modification methylase
MKWHTEQRKISDLIPTENNPRQLTQKQYSDLEKSLKKFDLAEIPAINTTGQILAGHMRLKVLTALGRGDEIIDVRVPDEELSPGDCQEYVIRSNKNTGEWDWDTLSSFDTDDLKEWGFDDKDLKLFDAELTQGNTDENDIPETPETSKTKTGDLWILGDHKLLCGNSANHDDIIKLIGTDLASCIFTDPPYGVSIGKKNVMLNSFQKAGMNLTDIIDDGLSPEKLKESLAPAFSEIKNSVMAEDCTLFVCSPEGCGLGIMTMMMMMQESCHRARHVLIWKKNSPTFSMGRLDYDYQHEPILLTWGKKHKRPMHGTHKTSVWEIDKPRQCKEHPTMKPVELYINAYLNNSDKGDIVFDGFAGSGTAIIAAEQTGRKARLMEISPHYCDVIVKRWQDFSGKEAINTDGGKWNDREIISKC